MEKGDNARVKKESSRKGGSNSHGSSSNQLFFDQKGKATSMAPKQSTQDITFKTPTEYLLAAILEELRMMNALSLVRLQKIDDQEEAELQAFENAKKEDEERFDSIRSGMYL